MNDYTKFYIDGQWDNPVTPRTAEVINPATEQSIAMISMGSADDVNRAVAVAREAFPSFSQSSKATREALLSRIIDVYKTRLDDIAQIISLEMGCPISVSRLHQASLGLEHFQVALDALRGFEFERIQDDMVLRYEPIGVCGLITPWNWPANQVSVKVAPALAAGCTVVLKPSEIAPLDAMILAEIMHEAKVPNGVFNLINGDGPGVGAVMAAHEDIDMMSFTGSTQGGIAVAKASADTVKRVCQELGGKSANIILDDADMSQSVSDGINDMMMNSGQSCNAPTRILVPHDSMEIAKTASRKAVEKLVMGDPSEQKTQMGPVVSELQYNRIQRLIQCGIDEGATLVVGGLGKPEGLPLGYYVRPTVFADVTENMTVAIEEIFGPVVCIMGYEDEDHAVAIANNSKFGLAGYVSSNNIDHARHIAEKIRAGQVAINYVGGSSYTPFGGYKRSGNGREKGVWGLVEYLELKAMTGVL
ncbi:MAG: aldehyde dehydrogenase family protein [Ostreibacterium sp.]